MKIKNIKIPEIKEVKKRVEKIKNKTKKITSKIRTEKKDDVEKYLNSYMMKNTKGKRITKPVRILFLCVLAILFILIAKYKPLESARDKLYARYEEYKVEQAIERQKREEERERRRKNILSVAYNTRYPAPINGTITSGYGYRTLYGKSDKHTGIDISGVHRDNVISIADGVVTFAGVQNGYGNCVEIRHDTQKDGTFYTFYAHLSSIKVSKWQAVSQGEVIGLEGGARTDPNHGNSTGHHLHFEVRTSSGYGNDINPYNYIY